MFLKFFGSDSELKSAGIRWNVSLLVLDNINQKTNHDTLKQNDFKQVEQIVGITSSAVNQILDTFVHILWRL